MSAPEPPSLADRITYTYEGGPLNGRTTYHAKRPTDLSEPVLHRHTTCLKGADTDRTAAGLYSIENRNGVFVAVHHPSDQDEEWHRLKKEKDDGEG